jgi:hypothetical protein
MTARQLCIGFGVIAALSFLAACISEFPLPW